jgi:hypothetical protein
MFPSSVDFKLSIGFSEDSKLYKAHLTQGADISWPIWPLISMFCFFGGGFPRAVTGLRDLTLAPLSVLRVARRYWFDHRVFRRQKTQNRLRLTGRSLGRFSGLLDVVSNTEYREQPAALENFGNAAFSG